VPKVDSDERAGPASKAAPVPNTGTTVLAFDFGEKRVGVAVGDLGLRIAHPLTTITAEDNTRRFAEIQKLISEWMPVSLVVGLPMHADGTEHEVSRLARRFAQRLEGRFGIRATLVDERLTSRAAETRLKESGLRSDKIQHGVDAAAAREILESFFAGLTGST
jgi:putative Holliday junction resolvase